MALALFDFALPQSGRRQLLAARPSSTLLTGDVGAANRSSAAGLIAMLPLYDHVGLRGRDVARTSRQRYGTTLYIALGTV